MLMLGKFVSLFLRMQKMEEYGKALKGGRVWASETAVPCFVVLMV